MILRTVDLHVTGGAVLESRGRLVMEARRIWRTNLVGSAVAFQAKLADLISLEQFCIGSPVRSMANSAAFQFERRVLEHERPLLIGVTLHAGGVRAGRESCLFRLESAVWIVTVTALDYALQDFVMEGLSELALCLAVTLEAQLRLTLL
jgi:hypothetical protein